MKKIREILIFCLGIGMMILVLSGCSGQDDKRARLDKLQTRYQALGKEIQALKAQIGEEDGNRPVAVNRTQVRTVVVSPRTFNHYIRVQGMVESDNNVLVPFQSSGLVKKIHVRTGQRVRKGQILVELDAAVLESTMEELKQSLSLARTLYERQSRLWKQKIGSEVQYLQARNNKEALEKKLQTLREQVAMTRVTAPLNGTVDSIPAREGEMAAAGRGAIRIVQLTRLKITASLAENYMPRVQAGDPVKVNIPVINHEFEHAIEAVSRVIDPGNRTFEVEIRVPGEIPGLRPHMMAVVHINDYRRELALVVPQNVVQERDSIHYLFVARRRGDGWVARERKVKTGEFYNGEVEITDGLKAGERLIVFGFRGLEDENRILPEKAR